MSKFQTKFTRFDKQFNFRVDFLSGHSVQTAEWTQTGKVYINHCNKYVPHVTSDNNLANIKQPEYF